MSVERGHAQVLAPSMPQRKRTESAITPGVPSKSPILVVGFLLGARDGSGARRGFSAGKYRSRVFGGVKSRAGIYYEHGFTEKDEVRYHAESIDRLPIAYNTTTLRVVAMTHLPIVHNPVRGRIDYLQYTRPRRFPIMRRRWMIWSHGHYLNS